MLRAAVDGRHLSDASAAILFRLAPPRRRAVRSRAASCGRVALGRRAARAGRRRGGRRRTLGRAIVHLLRVGVLPTRRASGAAGPPGRSLRLCPLSGVLQRSRAPCGAARPRRRGARPELHARRDGGGPRRADAPSSPLSPPARAARMMTVAKGLRRRRCSSLAAAAGRRS